jgi:hypothetical protein
MFSLEFYRWLHIVSVLMVFTGLVGLVAARSGGKAPDKKTDRMLALIHGFGMLGVLVAGFGAMARLGFMSGWPWWINLKLAIWLYMGGSMALAKRKAQWGPALLASWIIIGGVAAYFGIYKPATY